MNNKPIHNPRIEDRDPVDQILQSALGSEAPQEAHTRAERHFGSLRTRLQEQADSRTSARDRRFRPFGFPFAWAGAGAACSLAVVLLFLALAGHASLSWADVVARFKSVQYFSATVYITDNPLKQPDKIEIWMAKDRKSRTHHRGRVFFAEGKDMRKVYDVDSRQEIPVASMDRKQLRELNLSDAVGMIEMLGSMEEFSLDAVLATFSGRKTISPPLENSEASIAEDMQVFDVTGDISPEWMRIWVLKSSGLPLRMRVWDPRGGDCTEVLWDYMKEQPAEAFDPEAYKEALSKRDGGTNNLYALLRDPGGRQLTPGDMFKESGFHIPKIEEVGRTEEGVVWVRSSDSRNVLPNGRRFYGFGMLTDDLGQEYLHSMMGNAPDGDTAIECFVPLNYALDFRKPASYTLTCWSQPDVPYEQATQIVGVVKLKEWRDNAPVPQWLDGKGPGKDDFLKRAIDEHRQRQDWNSFDRLLALIPGEPEKNGFAFWREKQSLMKMIAFRDVSADPEEGLNKAADDGIFALTSRLFPLVKEKVQKATSDRDFPWEDLRQYGVAPCHVEQLLKRGQRSQAGEVLRLLVTEERINKAPKGHTLVSFSADVASKLSKAGMSSEEIRSLFGFDVLSKPAVAEWIKIHNQEDRGWKPEKDPGLAAWREYAKTVSSRYNARPLPERIEFLPDSESFDPRTNAAILPLPGKEGYSIVRFNGGWEHFIYSRAPVSVADALKGQKFNVTCVYRSNLKYEEVQQAFLNKAGVEVVDKTIRRKVWVAKYDGRKLPYWRAVRPLDASHLGAKPAVQAGGFHTTAASLFERFEDMANSGRENVPGQGAPIMIVDETGLPSKPGKNQTWGSICLTYKYAFWGGEEGTKLARKWFEESFGITFHEEERDVPVKEIRPVSSTSAASK